MHYSTAYFAGFVTFINVKRTMVTQGPAGLPLAPLLPAGVPHAGTIAQQRIQIHFTAGGLCGLLVRFFLNGWQLVSAMPFTTSETPDRFTGPKLWTTSDWWVGVRCVTSTHYDELARTLTMVIFMWDTWHPHLQERVHSTQGGLDDSLVWDGPLDVCWRRQNHNGPLGQYLYYPVASCRSQPTFRFRPSCRCTTRLRAWSGRATSPPPIRPCV